MPDISVGDVFELTIGYRVQAQQCLLVRHYVCANAPVDLDYYANLEFIANEVVAGTNVPICEKLAACMHSDNVINFVQVQGLTPVRRFYLRSSQNIAGTNVGTNLLPANCAAVIILQPNVPGRGRTGTAHIGGLCTSAAADDGRVAGDYQVALLDLADELRRGIGGAAPNHYFKPCMYNAAEASVNLVIEATLADTMRVMRRRTVGLGI